MAFTKVVGAGIHTLSNIASHNINSSGIITSTKFVGPFDGSSGDFSGNVTIGGDLTVNGTTSTIDTNLIGVDKIEVTTASTNVAVAVTHNGSGDLVRLYDGASQVVTVDDTGKVGIGTVTPGTILHTYSSTTPLFLLESASYKSYIGTIQSADNLNNGSAAGELSLRGQSGISFSANNGTATQLRINSSGELISTNGTLRRNVSDSSFTVSGDTASNTGANINLYGASHASLANIFRIRIGASEKLRITSDGVLKITGQTSTLETAGLTHHTNNNLYIRGGTTGAIIQSVDGNEAWIVQNDYVSASTAGAERLRITSDGYVGINTSSVNTLLHIVHPNADEDVLKIEAKPVSANTGAKSKIAFQITQSNNQSARLADIVSRAVSNWGGQLSFHTKPANGTPNDTTTERLRITSDGKTIISSPSAVAQTPVAILDVFNQGTTTQALRVYRNDLNDNTLAAFESYHNALGIVPKMVITSRGKVGINTDNPQRELHVKPWDNNPATAAPGYIRIDSQGSDQSAILELYHTRGNGADKWPSSIDTVDGGLTFRVATGNNGTPQERVRITSAGVVDVTGSIIVDDSGGGTGLSINGVSGQTCGVVRQRDDMQHAIIFRGESNADGSTITGGNTTEYREYGDHVFKTGHINQHERLRINTSGNVGIGTSIMDSSADLSITNDTSARIYLKSGNASDASIYFGRHNDSATAAIRYEHSDNTFDFYGYNNSKKLTIKSDGHVIPGGDVNQDLGANTSYRWRNIYGQTLSLTSYATVGSIVASDPGSAYYAYNNRIGGGLAIAGNTRMFNNIGIGTARTTGLTNWEGPSDINFYLKSNNASGTIRWNYEDAGGTVRANHAFVNYGNNLHDYFSWSTHDGSSIGERVRISKEGDFMVKNTSAATPRSDFLGSLRPISQIASTWNAYHSLTRHDAGSSYGPYLILAKNKNDAYNSNGAVADNDEFGNVSFQGNDGNVFREGARIRGEVDGTVASNQMPGALAFWTNNGSGIAEKFRVTPQGTLFVSTGTTPVNQCEAATGGAAETLGLMVKRSICFSDSDLKGQGMVMVSHTKSSVPCDGTVTDMLTIRNREGCFIGDVYVGYSASGSAAVCHKKFHTYYNGNTLSNENTPAGRTSESIDITCASNGDVHVFKVTPNNSSNPYQNGSNLRVTMSIIALSAGFSGTDNYTVTYH